MEHSTRGDETVKFPIRRGWTNLDVLLSWTEPQLLKHFRPNLLPMALRLHFIFYIPQPFGGISQNIKCSFRFILSPLNWRRIVKHGEIVILFPIALFRVMFSTIPSGSCTHTHLHKKKQHTTHSCLLEPPMEEHSVLGWGEPFFFFGGGWGGWPRAEATSFAVLCCCLDLFWNVSDLRRLAHAEGVALFGKRLRIFWQNCSQLQGQNVVVRLLLWGCVSLMSWRFEGGAACSVAPVLGD